MRFYLFPNKALIVTCQCTPYVTYLPYALLPMRDEVVPPGQPTVDSAGPLLPALDTNTMLYLSQRLINSSVTALHKEKQSCILTVQYVWDAIHHVYVVSSLL